MDLSKIKFRDKVRQNCQQNRNKLRFDENDSFRLGIGEIVSFIHKLENITEEDVNGICVRIKRRKHAGMDDLFRLSQAFLQSNRNITVFAKTPGALQIIVKELTGQDSEQKIRAAETLCNLSLGDEVVCEKIANQSGSYLVTFLESIDFRLKQFSLWTLINIVATGGEALETLLAMEFFLNCSDIFYSKKLNEDLSLIVDTAICLNMIFESRTYGKLVSENKNIADFFQQMTRLSYNDERNNYLIKIIFNSSIIKSKYTFDDEQLEYLGNIIATNILSVKNFMSQNSLLNTLYYARVLSNIIYAYKRRFVNIFDKICYFQNTNLLKIINILFSFKNENFKKEMFWILKNILEILENEIAKNNFVQQINILSIT